MIAFMISKIREKEKELKKVHPLTFVLPLIDENFSMPFDLSSSSWIGLWSLIWCTTKELKEHSVWKSRKKSHFTTLRAKRATISTLLIFDFSCQNKYFTNILEHFETILKSFLAWWLSNSERKFCNLDYVNQKCWEQHLTRSLIDFFKGHWTSL